MATIFGYIKAQLLLGRRLSDERLRQRSEGYSIEWINGPEQFVLYREGNREVSVGMHFSFLNDVRIFVNSLRRWDTPNGEAITPFDTQRILKRLVRYFECWGGRILLDDSYLESSDEVKEFLRQSGIPFEELEGGIIRYTSPVE